MINYHFFRNQLKNTWPIFLSFALVYILFFVYASLDSSYIAPYYVPPFEGPGSYWALNALVYGLPSLIIFFVFGILLSIVLISRDINRGYLTSWLTSPMSRKTIFNTKIAVLIFWTILLNIWIIIFGLFFLGITANDLTAKVIGYLILAQVDWLCLSLLIVSICWLAFSCSQKIMIGLGITLGLLIWFAICFIMMALSENPDLHNLINFKYVTILSLFNTPLNFAPIEHVIGGNVTNDPFISPPLPLKAVDYAWQMPTMLVFSALFMGGSQWMLIRKNFSI